MFGYLKKFVNVLLGATSDTKLKPYWHHAELKEMSKKELEDLGRQYGHELDRRKKKDALIQELLDLCK
jgi:hypothetical protein